jgi:hypothetical protein
MIRKQESCRADGKCCEQKRKHNPLQGNACGFRRGEFKVFRHVSEGHDGRHQDGQWQGHGNQVGRGVEQQLGHDHAVESFTYKVIDVFPKELHQ